MTQLEKFVRCRAIEALNSSSPPLRALYPLPEGERRVRRPL